MLGEYFSALKDVEEKKRYQDKWSLLGGLDPYETTRMEWLDDVDLWPTTTHMHVGMYLLHTPSPYTGDELLNYKSLDCCHNVLAGWVREVLVKVHGNKRIVVAKVSYFLQHKLFKSIYIFIIGESFSKNERKTSHSMDCCRREWANTCCSL